MFSSRSTLWLSMFLGPMAITRAILIIGSMVLLALHRHFSFNNGHGQTGLEFSAIDTWNLATLIFTFLALVELILITCMASAGRSGRFLSCFGRKERDGKNYYNFEPLYEELNDLRARKTRRTCTCCSHSALAFDIISLFVAAAAWGVFCFFYFFATNDLLQFVNKMPGLLFGSSEAVDFATTETPIEAITELF
uniref:DUF4149 domain-containing protein n=1 Tax=Panagrellus redivivus TaxID=6233 RepID=A0A7E4VT71_PANRE